MPRKVVAVEPLYDKDLSPSGLIVIPDSAKERCDQGLVKYIGEDCRNVFIGAHVIFSSYAGQTLQIEGEGTLIILQEHEIAAIIETQPVDVEGLYFRDANGEYHTITYEQTLWLIANSLSVVNRVDRSYDKRKAKKEYKYYSTRTPDGDVKSIYCDSCGAFIGGNENGSKQD